jgi:hypothetical protein
MRLLKITFTLLLFSGSITAFSQPPVPQNFLPALTPGTPETAAFARYGNYPVNSFTGLPNISIPIYEIKVGDLKLPISISYHASGNKVDDIPTWVGLGWSLQAGGMITRKVMGQPDEQNGMYLSATPTSSGRVKLTSEVDAGTTTQDGLDYLRTIYDGDYDTQPDIFTYDIPGESGKFVFNQADNFNPYVIPYAPVKIKRTTTGPNMDLSITDEFGRLYQFNNREATWAGKINATSAWKMTEMISTNKQDTIHLKYFTGPTTQNPYYNDYFTVTDNVYNYQSTIYQTNLGEGSRDQETVTSTPQILNEIDFRNGKILFEQGAETREDFQGGFVVQKRLSLIKIFNYDALYKAYRLIKTIQFDQSYFINGTDGNTKRLRLDAIEIKGADGQTIQKYQFDYNLAVGLPDHYSSSKDYWGYFNNRINTRNLNGTNVPTTIPQQDFNFQQDLTIQNIKVGGSNPDAREPDPDYMQAWILKKITYPTGGNSQFEYETNQYLDDNGNPKYAGGLRIKQIKSYENESAVPSIKTYKYGDNESGYGRANFMLENYLFTQSQTVRYLGTEANCVKLFASKTVTTIMANPSIDIETYDGSPVVYPVVTEYIGDESNNTGKTIYRYLDRPDAKTTAFEIQPIPDSYHFIRGLLLHEEVYKKTSTGYSLVKENRNGYQAFPFQFSSGKIGLAVKKNVITQNVSSGDIACGPPSSYCGGFTGDTYSYRYSNYEILTGDNKLVADTSIVYDQNDPTKYATTISSFTYDDNQHLQITQKKTINSKNEVILSTYTYPYNYSSNTYNGMVSNNNIVRVIKEENSNAGTSGNTPVLLTRKVYNYYPFDSYNTLPDTIQFQTLNNSIETRATFNKYDLYGNSLEMQKTSDLKQSFIWDYKNMYPIARCNNSSFTDIAYTSFESDGTGGWNGVDPAKISGTNSITGKRCYIANGFTLSHSVGSANSYTVSYWTTNGYPFTLTGGATGTLVRSLNGWNLYQHTAVAVAGGTITVSGDGSIDELRLYPATAQMETFAFEPLVGMTANCDVNNHITYFAFDPFGRLSLIQDENKNILKQYCYNYKGQTESCSFYGNSAESGTFTRNCSAGAIGGAATYDVKSNVYYASTQEAADAIAVADVAANGQAYADLAGTCTSVVPVYCSNSRTSPYNIRFTNNQTSQVYTVYVPANGNASVQITPGTYTVLFYPAGTPISCTFMIGSYSQYGTGATFYNISITSVTNASIGF